jgi:predicted enzyme related to lactoylglutathione lyase
MRPKAANMRPDHAKPGNGLILFFRVDDFDTALSRAQPLVTRLHEEPHVNPNTGTTEFSLRDPDGYYRPGACDDENEDIWELR